MSIKHALYLLLSTQAVLGAQPYLGCVGDYPEGDSEVDVSEGSTCLPRDNSTPTPAPAAPNAPVGACVTTTRLHQLRINRIDMQFRRIHRPNGEIFFDQTPTLQFRSIQECFDNCQSYTYAVARPDGESQEFSCFCGNDQGEFQYTEQVCDAGSEYIFQNVGESPSEIVGRRRLKERRELAKARKLGRLAGPACPKGLEACNVPGVDGAFECIDTNSELESCGGCAHGRFGEKIASRSIGVDCTSLPGVRLGASTCYEGKCEVYACKQGWYWSKGVCVKK
uniref:Protein CPL1-like domain-containing protein n=1 Tax=Kwoniella bestiolae CBS 10118 TaxID=1296100 RepID=A0A1B9G8A2_9TREE|nr:hypothetical protein I302_02104 [Kwoniella bestiolae CBS 10118]OCF27264.1 hypothetical protein I302_02104 [Kwoniella bestiolae CBS 10118]